MPIIVGNNGILPSIETALGCADFGGNVIACGDDMITADAVRAHFCLSAGFTLSDLALLLTDGLRALSRCSFVGRAEQRRQVTKQLTQLAERVEEGKVLVAAGDSGLAVCAEGDGGKDGKESGVDEHVQVRCLQLLSNTLGSLVYMPFGLSTMIGQKYACGNEYI